MGYCGPGKFGDALVPDEICGVDIGICCRRHDESYVNPRGKTKKEIDGLLLDCMLRRIYRHAKDKDKARAAVIAEIYYRACRGLLALMRWYQCRIAQWWRSRK